MKRIKIACVLIFAAVGVTGLFTGKGVMPTVSSFSGGPPAGFSGAPDENNCAACHFGSNPSGQFAILDAPVSYSLGQTYQLRIRHTTADSSRKRWGFEMTALAGQSPAGTFSNLANSTQIITQDGRFYIEHTSTGSFAGQTGGAQWTVNWTAPSTAIGPVTLYAAGNQANNDGTPDGDQLYTTSVTVAPPTPTPTPTPTGRTAFDFDGDRKVDLSIFRPNGAASEWWWFKSSTGGNAALQFGANTDSLVPADFTGDGKTDVAFWRPSTGQWFVLRSEDFSFFAFPFGATGDVPVPADFDGDGKADAAVFRESSLTWFISKSTGGTDIIGFGAAGDKPVIADYDGDGKADIAIYRPNGANGAEWWVRRSSTGVVFALQFGQPTDKTVPGDYTGDGKTDIAFWRPSNGNWFILRSEDFSFFAFPFGASTDLPVPGDYDGDGKIDAAVFRPSNSTWFANKSGGGTLIQQFGITGDVPLPNVFVR